MLDCFFESSHVSTHVVDAMLTQKTFDLFIERSPGLIGGQCRSIAGKLGDERSIEHWLSSAAAVTYPLAGQDAWFCDNVATVLPEMVLQTDRVKQGYFRLSRESWWARSPKMAP